jgi:hypothetical protein
MKFKMQRKGLEIRYKGCPMASNNIIEENLKNCLLTRSFDLLIIQLDEVENTCDSHVMDEIRPQMFEKSLSGMTR